MSRGNQKQVRESVRGSAVGTSCLWWEEIVEKIGFESGMKHSDVSKD